MENQNTFLKYDNIKDKIFVFLKPCGQCKHNSHRKIKHTHKTHRKPKQQAGATTNNS